MKTRKKAFALITVIGVLLTENICAYAQETIPISSDISDNYTLVSKGVITYSQNSHLAKISAKDITNLAKGINYLHEKKADVDSVYTKDEVDALLSNLSFTPPSESSSLSGVSSLQDAIIKLDSDIITLSEKMGGCWIDFKDASGDTTTTPYIHWNG